MKTIFSLTISLFAVITFAQTNLQKQFSVPQGKELVLKFDYPQLIKISTWDKNEVEITGKVNINNGENNSFFEITERVINNEKVIEGKISNYKNLPQQLTAYLGKEKMEFNTEKELLQYEKDKNVKFKIKSYSAKLEIELEIKVPHHMKTKIESIYGTVEVKKFDAPIIAKSTYGSVDATLDEKKVGEILIESFYGKIYTNLNLPIKTIKSEDFHTIMTAFSGKEPRQEFSSQYGNIYLRK